MFSWLHLTDLHFGLAGQKELWPNVRKAFFNDLETLHERTGPWDTVVFTGDLVQRGTAPEFERLDKEVLGPLWDKLNTFGSGDAVLLAVPGNHDLVRPALSGDPTPAEEFLIDPELFSKVAEKFWDNDKSLYRGVVDGAFANFRKWWSGCKLPKPSQMSAGLLPGDFATTLTTAAGHRVGVLGLNTTFLQLAAGEYREKLVWDLRQFHTACGGDGPAWADQHDVCVLLTHQGPEWLDKRSRDEVYPEINSGGRFAVQLFGHMHKNDIVTISRGGGKPLRQWQGNSLFSLEPWDHNTLGVERRHGYAIGRIEFDGEAAMIRHWPRKTVKDTNGIRPVPDHDSCVLLNDEGTEPEPLQLQSRGLTRQLVKRAGSAPTTVQAPPPPAPFAPIGQPPSFDARATVLNPSGQPVFIVVQSASGDVAATERADPTNYLTLLRERHANIEIRGLQVASGRAPLFPIDELYIPLTTTAVRSGDGQPATTSPRDKELGELGERQSNRIELRAALAERQLVIIGDPGAGKTTLLRRIAFQLADALLRQQPREVHHQLGYDEPLFPIWMRVADIAQYVETQRSPVSLPQFLAHACAVDNVGLNQAFFERQMEAGRALVMLDGLDEAPNEAVRRQIAELFERTTHRYPKCRYVVTSRPAAVTREPVLPGYAHVEIEPLEDQAIETYLRRWCQALFAESPTQVQKHLTELLDALRQRLEIRRMARNPVMLTALAVVHWNEKRLPEQRADLYESIILWLARARDQRHGRPPPERCVVLLQDLALAMQNHPDGRQTQVTRHWAARQLVRHWRGLPEEERIAAATRFLEEEESDSGIVVKRGDYVRFWHLTFQEFLAARALTAQDDVRRQLLAQPTLYAPEWKEVALLLAGALYHQGPDRVDAMFSAILDGLGPRASLVDKALCVGLLGGAVHDLSLMQYQPSDTRYHQLLRDVEAVFEQQWLGQAESTAQNATLGGIWTWLVRRATLRPTLPELVRLAVQVADVLGQVGTLRYDPVQLDQQWVTIPAGRFWMGAQSEEHAERNFDLQAYTDESPVHEVELSEYQLARFPVTVGQFRRFVESDGYKQSRFWTAGGLGSFTEPEGWETQLQHPGRPVVGVSWHEATAYCVWLGVRLPTEAQWERAARVGDGRKYPWSDAPPTKARLNYGGNVGHLTPVGIYPLGASPEGVEELAGNVWEWCGDSYVEYPTEFAPDPQGPPEGVRRVLRGGCWLYSAVFCRSSYRGWLGPSDRGESIGFRVARSPSVQ